MANQQVSNPPSAAYYLTLIGGILGVIVGIFLIFILVGVWIIIANVLMIVYAQRIMAATSRALTIWNLHHNPVNSFRIEPLMLDWRHTRSNIPTNADHYSIPTLPNNRTLYTTNRVCLCNHQVLPTMR